MMKNFYLPPEKKCTDISFCTSKCGNDTCTRKVGSALHKQANKERCGWVSIADFTDACLDWRQVQHE